jgi:hypothetical protein
VKIIETIPNIQTSAIALKSADFDMLLPKTCVFWMAYLLNRLLISLIFSESISKSQLPKITPVVCEGGAEGFLVVNRVRCLGLNQVEVIEFELF